MRHRFIQGCALSAALVATSSLPARAQTKTVPGIHLALYYDVPQALSKRCYQASDLQDRLYVAVQYNAFEPPAVDGKLLVRIAEAGSDVEVSWVHEDADGNAKRPPWRGKAKTCYEALDDAIAALKDYLPPPITPPPIIEPPPIIVQLGGGVGVRLGTGRAPAPGLALDLGVRWREKPVSLSLEVRAALPVVSDVPTLPGTRAGTWLMSGALLPCGHYRWFVGCGLVEVGAIPSVEAKLASGSATLGAYLALGVRAALEIPVEKEALAVRFSGDLTGVPTTTQISSSASKRDEGDVWTMPRINGAFMAGVVGFFGK